MAFNRLELKLTVSQNGVSLDPNNLVVHTDYPVVCILTPSHLTPRTAHRTSHDLLTRIGFGWCVGADTVPITRPDGQTALIDYPSSNLAGARVRHSNQ